MRERLQVSFLPRPRPRTERLSASFHVGGGILIGTLSLEACTFRHTYYSGQRSFGTQNSEPKNGQNRSALGIKLIEKKKQKDVVRRPLQDAASGLHFRPPPERLLRGLPRALPPVLPLLHPPRHLLLGGGEDGGGEAALGLRRGNG